MLTPEEILKLLVEVSQCESTDVEVLCHEVLKQPQTYICFYKEEMYLLSKLDSLTEVSITKDKSN